MVAVVTTGADAKRAARVFSKVRELRRRVNAEPGVPHDTDWQVMNQLKAVFRGLPADVATEGVLSSVTYGDPLDISVAADLLSRVAVPDLEPLRIADDDLKTRLRAYLKSGIDVVLRRDDFNGEQKADLASAIAQVGSPEDMADLVRLIRADIERMHRGRAARAAGERGPRSDGAIMSYAGWHIAAVVHLSSGAADQVLISLLHEPEYVSDAAAAMARAFLPRRKGFFDRAFPYDLIWAAREGRVPPFGDGQRRTLFASALNAAIRRLQEQNEGGALTGRLKELAKALAAIDGRESAATIFAVISMPGRADESVALDAAERLLLAGVILPATIVSGLVDSMLERTQRWRQDSDTYVLRRLLALCPFVDDPSRGVAKMRDVFSQRPLSGYELCELITALGASRSDSAIDLLCQLGSDARTFERCEKEFINAFAAVDTPRARELLVGFVDPDIVGLALTSRPYPDHPLVARLTELARRRPDVAGRLRELCERDLPERNRHVLSNVMYSLGTPDAVAANLRLINDIGPSPVPQGVWAQLQAAFVEQRSYGESPNVFTQHPRASNEVRTRLFRMGITDERRRKSAFKLLGQIEIWRLEYGRPTGEPRHPDLASGHSWPLKEI
jgi:hypothetical protein